MIGVNTASQTTRSSEAVGELFLRFRLDRQTTAVVPMHQTQAALVLPSDRVSAIPNLPAPVLGLFNRRSNLLWLVDLPQMLGLEPLDRHCRSYDLVLLKIGQTPLAIAIRAIQGVVRFATEEIKSPIGSFNPAFTPYLSGWILREQELVLVLDAAAIINSDLLSSNRSQSS